MEKSNIIQQFIDSVVKAIIFAITPLFEDLKKNNPPQIPEELLTRKKTCQILSINLSTLWVWTKKGRLKSYGCGNRVYYKRTEILNCLVELKPHHSKTGSTNKKISGS